jgi:hypothetical protein
MTVLVQLFTRMASRMNLSAVLHEEEIAAKVYVDELSSIVDYNITVLNPVAEF